MLYSNSIKKIIILKIALIKLQSQINPMIMFKITSRNRILNLKRAQIIRYQ